MRTYIFLTVFGSLSLWLTACKEPTIDEGILPLYEPATVDPDGGTWRTIVLKSAAEVIVPQPAAVTSVAYQQELNEIREGVLGLNPEQLEAVNYWAVGGVLRWNQIARQLVAKYNVASGPNSITGQSVPADPTNPIINAPAAARLYALLSVAQYDALVVAWRAKYQYNRPALAQQDVVTRVPVADVPSYPSEDAAVAEASCRLLAYLFPQEAAWLKAKAVEHKQSRLWAGANVPSDVKAGEALATTVVDKVIAYAQTDRFNRAGDPNRIREGLLNAPYDVKWQSLELPAREPVGPPVGGVKTWFDSTTVARNRPVAPPMTTSLAFQKDLAEVRSISDARTREQWRVADYWADGTATYTPAGNWNRLTEGFIQQYRQNELRAARTYALLNRAVQDASVVGWLTQFMYFVPRPSQMDPAIKTVTLIPNQPGYPSDHAIISAAAATVLSHVFPDEATNLSSQATEAALSQIYGGIQYRFDTEAGTKLGVGVGNVAVDWARVDGAK